MWDCPWTVLTSSLFFWSFLHFYICKNEETWTVTIRELSNIWYLIEDLYKLLMVKAITSTKNTSAHVTIGANKYTKTQHPISPLCMFLCNGSLIISITAIGHVWHLLKPLPSLQWRKGFYPEYLGSISLLWNSKDKYHPFSFVALNPNGVGFHLGEQDSSRHLLVLSSTPWKHIHICINVYLNIHPNKRYCNYPF